MTNSIDKFMSYVPMEETRIKIEVTVDGNLQHTTEVQNDIIKIIEALDLTMQDK